MKHSQVVWLMGAHLPEFASEHLTMFSHASGLNQEALYLQDRDLCDSSSSMSISVTLLI